MFRRSDLGGIVFRLLGGIAVLFVGEHPLVLTDEVSWLDAPAARSVLLGGYVASRGDALSLDNERLLRRRGRPLAAGRQTFDSLLSGANDPAERLRLVEGLGLL